MNKIKTISKDLIAEIANYFSNELSENPKSILIDDLINISNLISEDKRNILYNLEKNEDFIKIIELNTCTIEDIIGLYNKYKSNIKKYSPYISLSHDETYLVLIEYDTINIFLKNNMYSIIKDIVTYPYRDKNKIFYMKYISPIIQ